MWIYSQTTGSLWSPDGAELGVGYSGGGDGKNNPDMEYVKSIGPIPRGMWVIGEVYDSKNVGPVAIPLYPHAHDAFERTYFRIHGDSKSSPGNASRGCVILTRRIRELIVKTNDRLFKVIE